MIIKRRVYYILSLPEKEAGMQEKDIIRKVMRGVYTGKVIR